MRSEGRKFIGIQNMMNKTCHGRQPIEGLSFPIGFLRLSPKWFESLSAAGDVSVNTRVAACNECNLFTAFESITLQPVLSHKGF